MNLIYRIVSFVLFFLLLNSCSPIYQCGELNHNTKLKGSKRLKALVEQRDKLCLDLQNEENENVLLNQQISFLTDNYNDLESHNTVLQVQYESLINESLSQSDRLNRALNAKSEELAGKEKLLADRERSLHEMRKIIAQQDSATHMLNDLLRKALLSFNADELSVEIKNGKVYVSMADKLLFKSGSVAVENKGKEALKLLSGVLEKNKDIDVLVEGHTDNVPIHTAVFRDNWDLSVVRATSIVRILIEDFQMDPARLTASGKGEYFPRASNLTEEGRAKNRRTEIILSPRLDELLKFLNKGA
jgi:chemotaxis protein MotB